MVNEATIRDKLAKQLSIIEVGLSLIDIEYPVPNPDGSHGKIDILAKDEFGNRVIIELKRSNQAARQAIHELFKYSALLPQKISVPQHQIRCILISTEWRELIRPFSEFARDFQYSVEGYHLEIDEPSGTPQKATKVEILPPIKTNPNLELCPKYLIFFFNKRTKMRRAIKRIDKIASKTGLRDYCLLELESQRKDTYPYMLHLALDNLPIEELERLTGDSYDYYGDVLEEHLQLEFTTPYSTYADDVEISYPAKLVQILERVDIKSIHRRGKYEPLELLSDDELLELHAGIRSTNPYVFVDIISPKYRERWNQAVQNCLDILEPDPLWVSGWLWFLNKIVSEMPSAKVSVFAGNDHDIFMDLFRFQSNPSQYHFPVFEVIAKDKNTDRIMSLSGFLKWDGKTAKSVNDVLPRRYQDNRLHTALLTNGLTEFNSDIMSKYGLATGLIYSATTKTQKDVTEIKLFPPDNMKFEKYKHDKATSFINFLNEHKTHLHNLHSHVSSSFRYLSVPRCQLIQRINRTW